MRFGMMSTEQTLQGYKEAIAEGDYQGAYNLLDILEQRLTLPGGMRGGRPDVPQAVLAILVVQAKKHVGRQVLAERGIAA